MQHVETGKDMCYCFLCQILETDFAIALFVIILLTAQPNRMILPVKKLITDLEVGQGGRTWHPFVGGKNGHESFRQARIYNFRDKCVVFARNLKFANLIQ